MSAPAVVTSVDLVTDIDGEGVWVAIGEDTAGNKLAVVGEGATREAAEEAFHAAAQG